MKELMQSLREASLKAISESDSPESVEALRVRYLGKKGELTAILRQMGKLSPEERPIMGQLANQLRSEIEEAIELRKTMLGKVMLEKKLEAEAEKARLVKQAEASAEAGKIQTVAEAERRRTMADAEAYAIRTTTLAQFDEALGAPDDWLVEWKYDGIRAQLVSRSGQRWLWSRGEDLITDRFPEISAVPLPDGTVVDGEVLIWQDGAPALFADLQKRIGRKTLSARLLQELPAALIAYDLLEQDGEDLRKLPQRERRRRRASSWPFFSSPAKNRRE
jgi:DNA ligase-1